MGLLRAEGFNRNLGITIVPESFTDNLKAAIDSAIGKAEAEIKNLSKEEMDKILPILLKLTIAKYHFKKIKSGKNIGENRLGLLIRLYMAASLRKF